MRLEIPYNGKYGSGIISYETDSVFTWIRIWSYYLRPRIMAWLHRGEWLDFI